MRQVVLVVLAGCSFSARTADSLHDAAGGEGGPSIIDAQVDGSGAGTCTTHAVPPSLNVDPSVWAASFLTAPIWSCTQSGMTTVDTATGMVASTCASASADVTNNVAQTTGGSTVMVLRLRGLTLAGGHTLRVVGDKPLVVLVAGNVSIDGGAMIDASANGATPGPGGSPASCIDTASGLGTAGTSSNWGGGGGGFGTAGGVGEYMLANGGQATGDPSLVPLRGGCGGGLGGTTFSVTPHAGAGGGAIEIDASGTISVGASGASNIVASGGGAPANNGGGNGGGAGGAVLLVSPAMAQLGAMGALRANGGAGSEGCSSACNNPASGETGHKTDATQATDTSGIAGGGNNNDHGRRGGSANVVGGVAALSAAGEMSVSQGGGRGGGGGGGGRLQIATAAATSSCD